MRAGSYKTVRDSRPKRAGLFLKVFILTVFLGAAGLIVLPRAERLWKSFFPAQDEMMMRSAATVRVFDDVPEGSVYADAINLLQRGGIIRGFDDGTFRPDETIKREEFAKLVVSSLLAKPHMLSNSNCFNDVGREWFAPYVCFAKRRQYIGGYEDGSFGTGKTITVSEAISLLNKAFGAGLDVGDSQADEELTRGKAAYLLAKAMRLVR
jgi:hypothetical protein